MAVIDRPDKTAANTATRKPTLSAPPAANRIERIELTRHRLPLKPAFTAAWDGRPRDAFETCIVRIHAGDGTNGIASAPALDGIEPYLSLFLGEDPLDLERHHAILANIDFHGPRPWAIEAALWDLVGKIRKQPVWRLLGGRSGRVPCYASLGVARNAKAMAAKAREAAAAGFPAVKARLPRGDWRPGIEALEAAKIVLNGKTELLVDCNQGWAMPGDPEPAWTYHQALAVAWELKRIGVYWMEEPVHHGDVKSMAAMRAATGLRIAAGEMTRGEHALRDLVDRNAVDILQPDAVLTAGILGIKRAAAFAATRGVDFTPHTWGDGIGLLVNAHVFAGLGGAPWLEYPVDGPEWTVERRDFMLAKPILADKQGCITLTDAPGFGIELNEEKLAETRVED